MNQIQSQVREFMLGSGQECPTSLKIPDKQTRSLRVRLLLEEVLEFAESIGIEITGKYFDGDLCLEDLFFDDLEYVDLTGVADALADINYVSYGAAVACGLDLEPIEQAVHDNNMTKFIDGWVDENGKFRKGPLYKPLDLKPLVDAQLK